MSAAPSMPSASAVPGNVRHEISEAEQKKLDAVKNKTRFENESYLRSHPEIAAMISSFTKEALREQPENVAAFAGEFFNDPELETKIFAEQKELAKAGPVA